MECPTCGAAIVINHLREIDDGIIFFEAMEERENRRWGLFDTKKHMLIGTFCYEGMHITQDEIDEMLIEYRSGKMDEHFIKRLI
jgi:hypothetical protein